MNFLKLSFNGPLGERLSGRLDLPALESPDAYVLFAHCFTCTKNAKSAARLGRTLADAGFAVLRFDFTGLGESEGDFSETNLSSNVEDLVAAARFLEAEFGPPSLLIGHSLGGSAVVQAAPRIRSVKGVVTIGASADPGHLAASLGKTGERIEREGEAEVVLSGRTFRLKKQLLADLRENRTLKAVAELGKPLLVLHAVNDDVVHIRNSERIFAAAAQPKSFIGLARADHLLSDAVDAEYVGRMIAAWSREFLPQPEDRRMETEPGEVLARIGRYGYDTGIRVRGHRLMADDPETSGTDRGPSPYEYLAAGLGACSAITLRMYADRKGWPLESVRVRLKHRKIEGGACTGDACDRIESEIELTGRLTEAERKRLLEIARENPVHCTLEKGALLEDRLKP